MSGLNQQFTKLSALNWAREFESRSLRNGYGYIITYMHRFTINTPVKIVLAAIGIYEALLVKVFLIAVVWSSVAFLFIVQDDSFVWSSGEVFGLLGFGTSALLSICTPLIFALNWYMVFSKKPDHPRWFLWLVPLPFIGLLIYSFLMGKGLSLLIPYF